MARSKSEFLRERRVLHRGHADVKDPLFREGTFFDPRDLMLVKYEMLRKVRLGQCSVTQACQDFGLSRTVYYEAYQAWQEEGMVGLLPARSGPQGPHKMTEQVTTFLEGLLAENGAASAEMLAKELKREMGLEVHPRTIEKVLAPRQKKSGKSTGNDGKNRDDGKRANP